MLIIVVFLVIAAIEQHVCPAVNQTHACKLHARSLLYIYIYSLQSVNAIKLHLFADIGICLEPQSGAVEMMYVMHACMHALCVDTSPKIIYKLGCQWPWILKKFV